MKSPHILFVFLCISTQCLAQTINGKVADALNMPAPGALIKVFDPTGKFKSGIVTNKDGMFEVTAIPSDSISITYIGFFPKSFKVESGRIEYNVTLIEDSTRLSETVLTAASSSLSPWVGASLFYNLDGSDPENLVGAAKININSVKRFSKRFRLNVIGNIAKIASTINTQDGDKSLRQIVQSAQGLSVGIEPLYKIISNDDKEIYINGWLSINYKLNSFKQPNITGIDNTYSNLSQGRFTAGIELDGLRFESGQMLHLGIEASMTVFDGQLYKAIFNQEKKNILGLEWTVIVPLFSKVGLMAGQTLAVGMKPIFSAGLILSK